MDESHRLKPMVENYDPALFNELYKATQQLRKKLAYGIDARTYGVDYYEVLSWFEVKFIYAFNKYYNDERVLPNRPQRLKGFVINALTMFHRKVVKDSYFPQYSIHDTVDITELFNYDTLLVEKEKEHDNLLDKVLKYLKERLSDEAFLLMNLELNPPPYILSRLQDPQQKKIPKPSIDLIAEYLGIDELEGYESYIKSLRKEVEVIKKQAKEYFSMESEYQST